MVRETELVVFPCRGYHHQVDRVRRVEHGEPFVVPLYEDVPHRVDDGGVHHQRDDRNGNDRIRPIPRPAVPSHSRDRLKATQRNTGVGRNTARVYGECGSEELWSGSDWSGRVG